MRVCELENRRDLFRPEARHAGDQIITRLSPVTAHRGRSEVMAHGRRLRRKKQPVDAAVRHTPELALHRALEHLIADLQFSASGLREVDRSSAAASLAR